MAQITLYLPDDLARQVRAAAKKAHKSLSAYVTELAGAQLKSSEWPPGFAELFGSWEGEPPPIPDPPPGEIEMLD